MARSLIVLGWCLTSVAACWGQATPDQQFLTSILPLIQNHQFPEAEKRTQDALTEFPGSAILNNALGIVYREENKYDEAVAAFQSALTIKPDYTAAKINLALLLANLNRKEEAAAQFAAAVRTASDAEVIAQAGVGLADLEQYEPAIEALQKAHALRPESIDISFNLAQALVLQKKCGAANDILQSLPKSESPDLLQLRSQIANCQESSTAESGQQPDAALVHQALNLIRGEKFAEAVSLLTSDTAKTRGSAELLSALGLAQFRLGKNREAIESYSSVLRLNPAADAAREGLVFLLYITGDLERAREISEERLRSAAADFYLYHLDAMVLYRLGAAYRVVALRSVNEAIQRKPGFAPSYFLRGKLELDNRNLPAALQDFERSVALDPKFALPYYKIAQIYRQQGHAAEAEQAQKHFSALSNLREDELLARQTQDVLTTK